MTRLRSVRRFLTCSSACALVGCQLVFPIQHADPTAGDLDAGAPLSGDVTSGSDAGSPTCVGCVSSDRHNVMFVTSEAYVPGRDFIGLAGADAKCQALADSAAARGTLPKDRHYRAWLSTTAESATSRLAPHQGWIRPDGRPFAASLDALVAGRILFPPRIDEAKGDLGENRGPSLAAVAVATGSVDSGLASNVGTATDWTSDSACYAAGDALATTHMWTTDYKKGSCFDASPSHLYCFGTDFDQQLELEPLVGRHAFLSQQPYKPGTITPDAFCQNEANAYYPGGTYRALLSTTAASAASRLQPGPPWVRPDGIPWVFDASDLVRGKIPNALNVDPSGTYGAFVRVWTGGTIPSAGALDLRASCRDWSSGSATDTAVMGYAHYSGSFSFFVKDELQDCDYASGHLYCLQDN